MYLAYTVSIHGVKRLIIVKRNDFRDLEVKDRLYLEILIVLLNSPNLNARRRRMYGLPFDQDIIPFLSLQSSCHHHALPNGVVLLLSYQLVVAEVINGHHVIRIIVRNE